MAWLGKKRVAFIPVFRPQLDAVPADWEAQILRRIYHDPQPWPTAQPPADPGPVIGRGLVPAALPPAQTPGPDISLRTHIHTTSYGRADIEGIVLPRVQTNLIDVRLETFHDRTHELRGQGFDAAAIVMLGGAGAGTAEAAGFWARFVMVEGVGVWAMELIHVLAGYMDLYANARGPVVDHLGPFDTMAGAGGQHECAFSKVTRRGCRAAASKTSTAWSVSGSSNSPLATCGARAKHDTPCCASARAVSTSRMLATSTRVVLPMSDSARCMATTAPVPSLPASCIRPR